MAVGDTRDAGVRLREVEPSDAERVRHFDQLRDDRQREFLRLYRGEPVQPSLPTGLVIVFTDYYRIERA